MFRMIRYNADWKHVRDAILYIIYYAVGTLMPLWAGLLLLSLMNQPIGSNTFLDQGQFAIYSAAALTPVVYVLSKDHKGHETAFYMLIMVVCLLISVLIFTLAESTSLAPDTDSPNKSYLRIASVIVYIFSLFATFCLQLFDSTYNDFDMQAARQTRRDSLEVDFEREFNS